MKESNHLYNIQKTDIQRSSHVLASAFLPDPVWNALFKDMPFETLCSFFEGPARYGRKYGQALAYSEKLEGMAVWTHSSKADMTPWRALRSGTMGSSFKLGMKFLKKMMLVFTPLEEVRKKNMKGREYNYLMVLGVHPDHQGKGVGKKLLTHVLNESDKDGLPVYLETSTEKNVEMYKRYGFKVIGEVIHPVIELPQWEMLREPL